jgi:protein SCO1
MKTKIITAAIFVATALFMASCGNSSIEKSNENATEEVKTSMYQCPMKCEGEKMYEEQGTCPVCKMDLELVPGNEHLHHEN